MYRVEVVSRVDSRYTVRSKDSEFTIDTKGNGITPSDTLLASLASCIGVYIRKYAEGAKLVLGEFRIDAEAEFTRERPFRFKTIKVAVDLKGAELAGRRKESLLAFIKNCPIHNTLKDNPDIDIDIL